MDSTTVTSAMASTGGMTQLLKSIPFISAMTALIAVIVGPLIQYIIGKRQHVLAKRQLNLSSDQFNVEKNKFAIQMKQEWIEKLRDTISEIITSYTLYHIQLSAKVKEDNVMSKLSREIFLNLNRVDLLLNPHVELHLTLICAIQQISLKDLDLDIFRDKRKEIIKLSQDVLKYEWDRLKEFEKEITKASK